MLSLENKTALITGSSRGIGLTIAKKFASLGCNIILNGEGMNLDLLDQLKNDFHRQYQVKTSAFSADVSSNEEVIKLYEFALKEHTAVDIIVNNAGITRDNLLLRMKEEDWNAVLDINLKSAFLICKHFSRNMLKLGKGRIINISSVVGQMGNAGQTNYSASKSGLIGFSKSLARELASKKITVNVIAPGYIKTQMTDNLNEEVKNNLLNLIPLKELGTSEDIANLAAFLASDLSGYITGQVIGVNGGMLM